MRILVTGGAGYIGSHTTLELLRAGHDVVVVDNLINSHEEAVRRVETLAGRPVSFHRVDLLDGDRLAAVFAAEAVDAVIHFAALKSVGESVAQPLRYYHNNVTGTIQLLEVMDRLTCGALSSAPPPPSMALPKKCRSPRTRRSSRSTRMVGLK